MVGETTSGGDNPYVGPRAFQLHEANFYGRDREARALVDLLTAERVVLLHSPSGAGKTSLVQAGLVPALEKDFHILPIIRVGQCVSGAPTANRYVFSTLLSLEGAERSAGNLAGLTLAEALARRTDAAESRPQLLIFDQFEEVWTLDPYDLPAKEAFFAELAEVLRRGDARRGGTAPPTRWALFAMRDEFVAALAPYFQRLPTGLGETSRLDRLGVDAALEAVSKPAAQKGVTFSAAAAGKLVDNLRTVRRAPPPAAPLLGLHVEPVQLQVVCFRLWERLRAEGKTTVEEADVERLADVDNALADFYAERVKSAAARSGVNERAVRLWFEQRLITPQGVRAILQVGVGDQVLDDSAVNELVDAFLVRREERRGLVWLELSHDRLIEPIRRDNVQWLIKNLSKLQLQAVEWGRQGRPRKLLLSGLALVEGITWASRHKDSLMELDQEFLEASRQRGSTGDILKSYLLRGWAALTTVVCATLIFLVWNARREATRAEKAEQDAKAAQTQAETEKKQAEANLSDYLSQRELTKKETQRADKVSYSLQQTQSIASRQKVRPVQPGTSISGPRTTAGTLCCLVQSRNSRRFLLTTKHSIALGEPVVGDRVLQPGIVDGGKPEQDAVAKVVKWVPTDFNGPNRTGGVIAEFLPNVKFKKEVLAFGAITGVGDAQLNEEVVMVGRASPFSKGLIVRLGAEVKIDFPQPGGGVRQATFQNLIGIKATSGSFSQAGDSGAPVLSADGKLLGMLVKGSVPPGGEMTYALPIRPILEALKVELLP